LPPTSHAHKPLFAPLLALALALLLASVPATLHGLRGEAAGANTPPAPEAQNPPPSTVPLPEPRAFPPVAWRSSRALGYPMAGRLVRGVQLPVEGEHFFTWDPILKRSPNRGWRRHGTDALVARIVRVAAEFRAANPDAPRVAIGDLSRPRGGDFGPRFGGLGHASHQNGLDADVYYPRIDRLERAPRRPAQVDSALAQDLVDRFVATGAQFVFVGPRTGLDGPRRVVQELVHHDDHLHLRIRRQPLGGRSRL
jgi:murein endopeptidase